MEDNKQPLVQLEESTKEVVNNIIATDDSDEFKNLIDLFNLNQSKKNALRVAKLNELLDKIEDQAIERFNKNPGQMSNRDLLDYLEAIQDSIDRSNKYIGEAKAEPMIQVNTITVNNDTNELDRESREKVIEVVKALIGNLQNQPEDNSDIIDMTSEEDEEEKL